MPAQYMFKDIPAEIDEGIDPVAVTLHNMDRFGIERAMCNVGNEAREEPQPGRPGPSGPVPAVDRRRSPGRHGRGASHQGVPRRVRHRLGLELPLGVHDRPINAAAYYPIYAACVELDIPIFLTVGVPGPRIPLRHQKVELLDEVCWFFPELKIVMRHGAEPWDALAVKLMLKWPNLYYSTSAFAPKHYPKTIIDYANTRGADKVIYAGYFPAGLTYDRIMAEMPNVAFKDDVWPKFLRENALKVLGLD